jgi:PAT family beta-lactamase induction signal transducer AmpG
MQDTKPRWFRLTMFGMLYFVQGAALAYFRNYNKPYLNSVGIDVDTIGILSTILLLPFIIKIFIGMLSDRVSLFGMGYRKPYMILGLVLAAVAFGLVAFVLPDSNFPLFAALTVLGSFSVTIFDSTTDGLAIDCTPPEDHGTVQGIMTGGRAVGIILLSTLFGYLVESQGFRVVFLIIAGAMLLPLIWVMQIEEPEHRPEQKKFDWQAFGALGKPRFLLFAAYAIFYSIVSFGVDGLVTLYMSSGFNASDQTIGHYGSLRGIGAVIGAVAAGFIFDRIGRKVSAFGAMALISIGGILIGLAAGIPMLLVMGVIWGMVWGFQETIFVSLAMDLSDHRIAASMFAIMMAISNIGTAIGEGVATSLTDDIGFAAVFIGLAVINVINVPILGWLFKTAPEINVRAEPAKS